MSAISADLVDHMGDDLRVVNAARVSFDKETGWDEVCLCGQTEPSFDFPCTHGGCSFEPQLSERDAKLVRYLAKHQHFTPFTHTSITLREHVPIFVARQRFKHVVGFTYNEVSRRYVDEAPQLFRPDAWRGRAESVKQGSGEVIELPRAVTGEIANAMHGLVRLYERLLREGVCPEQARMVLPQSMMTSYYVTGNVASFARAYKQRSDSHAQKEIRDLAEHWDRIIRPLFPHSWSALVD